MKDYPNTITFFIIERSIVMAEDMKKPPMGPDGKPMAPPSGDRKPPMDANGKPMEPPKDANGKPMAPPDKKVFNA